MQSHKGNRVQSNCRLVCRSRMKVLLLVDSNLKRLKVGRSCPKLVPYFRCAGDNECVYKVDLNHRSWPSIEKIRQRQYTDVVIALGMNHCKILNDDGESQGRAVSELFEFYLEMLRQTEVRLYFVKVPPSVDSRINDNIRRYNSTMCMLLSKYKVTIVHVPEQFYADDGTLKTEYARANELRTDFHGQKLHLSNDAQNVYCYVIQRVICKTAGKRKR